MAARIQTEITSKGSLNWVRCRIEKVLLPDSGLKDGPEFKNRLINLDTVIQFYVQVDALHDKGKEPRFWVVTFECVDGKNRQWYFKTRADALKTYDGLENYINKKSQP